MATAFHQISDTVQSGAHSCISERFPDFKSCLRSFFGIRLIQIIKNKSMFLERI